MQLSNKKKRLRFEYTKKRQSLHVTTRHNFANQAASHFRMLLSELSNIEHIAAYYPIREEMSTLPLLDWLNDTNYATSLPIINHEPKGLTFHQWNFGDSLDKETRYKVPEPKTSAKQVTPDLIIVPMLGFSRNGHRLGYGGGFYDRAIKLQREHNPSLITVGFAYSLQEIAHLPYNSHDQKIDLVITEKSLIECK